MSLSNYLFSLIFENPGGFLTWSVLAKLSAKTINHSNLEPL